MEVEAKALTVTLTTRTAQPGASAAAAWPGLSTPRSASSVRSYTSPHPPVSAGLTGHHACATAHHQPTDNCTCLTRTRVPCPGTPVAPPHSQNGVHDQLRAVGLDHRRGLLGAEHVGQVRALGRGPAGGSGGTRLTDARSAWPGYNRPDPSTVHRSTPRRSSTPPGGSRAWERPGMKGRHCCHPRAAWCAAVQGAVKSWARLSGCARGRSPPARRRHHGVCGLQGPA